MDQLDVRAKVFVLHAFVSGVNLLSEKMEDVLARQEIVERRSVQNEVNDAGRDAVEQFMVELGITWDDVERYKDTM